MPRLKYLNRPIRASDLADNPILYVVTQDQVHDQLVQASRTGGEIGAPFRRALPILEAATSCSCVAPQIARDRADTPD